MKAFLGDKVDKVALKAASCADREGPELFGNGPLMNLLFSEQITSATMLWGMW